MFGRLGLVVALVTVSIVAGVVVPFVLIMLSLLFGAKLRRAATACVNATGRAQAALARASARLANRDVQVRVADTANVDVEHTRVAVEPDVVEEADDWLDDRLERNEEEARAPRADAQPREPRRRAVKHWGR